MSNDYERNGDEKVYKGAFIVFRSISALLATAFACAVVPEDLRYFYLLLMVIYTAIK